MTLISFDMETLAVIVTLFTCYISVLTNRLVFAGITFLFSAFTFLYLATQQTYLGATIYILLSIVFLSGVLLFFYDMFIKSKIE